MKDDQGMSAALVHLWTESGGEGPVEVMTRLEDFNVITVPDERGKPTSVPARTLVLFTALRFRRLNSESDVWEFQVAQEVGPGVPPVTAYIYIAGSDVFMLKRLSKVL